MNQTLHDTRGGSLGLGQGLNNNERLDQAAVRIAPDTFDRVADQRHDDSAEHKARHLDRLLDDAVATRVISAPDKVFLDSLLQVAHDLPAGTPLRRDAGQGLLAAPIAYEIATAKGVTERTIRRRGTEIIQRLADAHRSGPSIAP